MSIDRDPALDRGSELERGVNTEVRFDVRADPGPGVGAGPGTDVRADPRSGARAGAEHAAPPDVMARRLRLRGLVTAAGFDSCVFRLAIARAIGGWIQHDDDGALLHIEGPPADLDAFIADLRIEPPVASRIAALELAPAALLQVRTFRIRPRDWRDDPVPPTRH